MDSPPRCVGNRNSPSNDDDADIVDPRTEGISVNGLETACSRVCLESTEVLMHILAIGESALQTKWNWFCSHKTRNCVDNDCREDLVTAADLAPMGSFEVIIDRREVPEHWYIEVMLVDLRICRQEPVERVACGRTAGFELIPFIDEDISSEREV